MLKTPLSILKNLSKGMKVSPIEGFAQVRGIDFQSIKGVAQIERAPVALTASGIACGEILWTTIDNSGNLYFLDNTGKLFTTTVGTATYSQKIGTGQTTTGASGNGLAYWKGHILVTRNGFLDAYKISADIWYTIGALASINSAFNPIFVGQDDKVYIGNGKNIASLTEIGTFDASNASTYTFVTNVLVLSQDFSASCFAELGNNLMIGTYFGADWKGNNNPDKTANIFPWSRNTAESFSLPIRIGDEGINSMITDNNLLYISAGIKGNVYVSNGVSVQPFFTIPLDSKQNAGDSTIVRFPVYNDAVDLYGNELLVGITQFSDGSVPSHNPIGIYAYFNGATRFIGNGSYNKDGSDGTRIRITSIYAVSPSIFYVGWWSGNYTGIDYYGPENNKVGSYGAYMESDIHIVGLGNNPASIDSFDFYLAKPLASGDGICLKYRTSNSGNWIDIATLDFATRGAVDFWSFPFSITNIKQIQFRIEATTTGTSSLELRDIIAN